MILIITGGVIDANITMNSFHACCTSNLNLYSYAREFCEALNFLQSKVDNI